MDPTRTPFRRKANPTAMIFRLSFIHSLYALPAWYAVRDLSRETLPGMLGTLLSVFILLTVFQTRLRNRINGKTESLVNGAVSDPPAADETVEITQSFTFRDYTRLNLQVMFSYLRPWLTVLSGLAFFVLSVWCVVTGVDEVRIVLSVLLAAYFLVLPWGLFSFRVRRAYRAGAAAMADQTVSIGPAGIDVKAGEAERRVTALTDIAVTRGFILLFVAGSNYLQVVRDRLDNESEGRLLCAAAGLVLPMSGA